MDVGGFGDNSRAIAVLGDDRTVHIGGGRQVADDTDGVVAILGADGAPDTTYAPNGCKRYDFGTPGDFLWAGAVSPNGQTVAMVGITGYAAAGGTDNDSALVLLPVAAQ